MPLKRPSIILSNAEKALFREHAYNYNANESTLNTLQFPMQNHNAHTNIVYLSESELDNYFTTIKAAYYNLYYAVFWEERAQGVIADAIQGVDAAASIISTIGFAMNFIPVIGQIGSLVCEIVSGILTAISIITQIATTKFRTYPSEIQLITPIIQSTLNLANITQPNQKIILNGVANYITMQQEEYNDFVQEEEYVYLSSLHILSIVENLLPQYQSTLKKIRPRKEDTINTQVPDLLVQAAGKDTTNEIDFAKEPIQDATQEAKRRTSETKSDGAILDFMRNRHSSEHAGGVQYDYEFSKVGFDIEFMKVPEQDNRGIYAHNAIIAQVAKSFALTLSSMHYCHRYEYDIGVHDICILKSHVVTDMKEKEINPLIAKFNSESKYKTQKERLNRYTQGYQPSSLKDVLLDLIDESIKAYYRQWLRYYSMGFAQDYIEYDEQRNFLYFKDREREVKIEYQTKDIKAPKLQYTTMQLLILYERGELGFIDGEGEFSPYPDIALLNDYESREYFEESDEENKSAPLYFEVRSEFVGVECKGIVYKTEWVGSGEGGSWEKVAYNNYEYTYKLIYNKRIYKSTLLKEIANAQAKRGEADKEQTNLDKLQQGGYI